jgi:RHS repeat-associated protein
VKEAQAAVPTGIYYYYNDHLGTPLKMVNSSGTTVWSADYLPFGSATVAPSSTIENNWRFPGQFWDGESGLHYNFYRFYGPTIGRYINADIVNPGLKNILMGARHDPYSPLFHSRNHCLQHQSLTKKYSQIDSVNPLLPFSGLNLEPYFNNPSFLYLFHMYSYSVNNPLSHKDYYGLLSCCEFKCELLVHSCVQLFDMLTLLFVYGMFVSAPLILAGPFSIGAIGGLLLDALPSCFDAYDLCMMSCWL